MSDKEVIKTKIIWESIIKKEEVIEKDIRYYKFPYEL